MQQAYVALGANLGDREASLRGAIRHIAAEAAIELTAISPVYETAPVGYTEQPSFLNMVAALRTELSPLELLRRLLAIEQEMGRVRDIRWGPRNIDLDLLVVGETVLETSELTLPHPRMGERAFVLVPLRDVWEDASSFPWERQLSKMNLIDEGIEQWAVWHMSDLLA
ncbi:MAG: 2-amino-4-hydroxy-6-hydroxymethyldihydropteridine diphosphokinase [Candidatus Cohnella colombiensis]|uniref:2-amino-4-hydroxy-6-hydroxymethyldihydropteridine diphosphokinase n=1 Tax=Candidatus Cohnella colombiensis TaxID=3121368 RepID=A0AA95JFW5_9BACL|nr:MAG: 2-amino-4-hydroxy-6-hydroxymethyldihydropteridine diphosphokinase [Cohnella sp.]